MKFNLLMAIVLILISFTDLSGCSNESSEDSADDSNDDSAGADDTVDTADDTGQDASDDSGGDDSTDDDIDDSLDDDDSADDDDTETRLLVIDWHTFYNVTSWLQSPDGWTQQPIPAPPYWTDSYNFIGPYFGPTFFLEGRVGYGAWNMEMDISGSIPWHIDAALGHRWIRYSPESGWSFDNDRPAAGFMAWVETIFAPSENSLWAASLAGYDYSSAGFPYGYSSWHQGGIHRQSGGADVAEIQAAETYVKALSVTAVDSGIACVDNDASPYTSTLLLYDGTAWSARAMPAGFEGGAFIQFENEDSENGFAVWKNMTVYPNEYALVEIIAGSYQTITPPAGCENTPPMRVYAQNGHVIAFAVGTEDSRFWEKRNGLWSCRTIEGVVGSISIYDALILSDGRSFVAGNMAPDANPYLIEVTEDEFLSVDLPTGVIAPFRLQAAGAGAPRFGAH